jgi:hypothetical protein
MFETTRTKQFTVGFVGKRTRMVFVFTHVCPLFSKFKIAFADEFNSFDCQIANSMRRVSLHKIESSCARVTIIITQTSNI